MQHITRREFTRKSALIGAGLATSNLAAFAGKRPVRNNELSVTIPMPIQIVIDDVGWWSGEDGNKRQEPYRTGIGRNHVPADYRAIVDLGIKLAYDRKLLLFFVSGTGRISCGRYRPLHGCESNGITKNGWALGWMRLQISSQKIKIIMS